MAIRESDWMESANCGGSDPNNFGINERLKYEENKANLEAGIEICMECPVFMQCYEDAEPDDFEWTVRAGRMPAQFQLQIDAREKPQYKTCKRGHVRLKGSGRCIPCRAVKSKEAYDRQEEKRAASRAATAAKREAARVEREANRPWWWTVPHKEWPAPAEGEAEVRNIYSGGASHGKRYIWRPELTRWVRTG